jgi:hypothetical protein
LHRERKTWMAGTTLAIAVAIARPAMTVDSGQGQRERV